jgi:hypothetical protein
MYYDSRPSDDWTLTIEYAPEAEMDDAIIENIALDGAAGIAEAELNNVRIDRCVISTWEPDSDPYDPASLRTIPIGIFGEREFLIVQPTADIIVHFMRKNVETGRTGKIQLRGNVLGPEMTGVAGEFAFASGLADDFQGFADAIWEGLTSATTPVMIGLVLENIIYPAVAEGVKQVAQKIYSDVPLVRPVTGLTSVKPSTRQVSQ